MISAYLPLPTLAICCDFPEEGWPSMDLCAEMLLRQLHSRHSSEVTAFRLCPEFAHRWSAMPAIGKRSAAVNADRLVNRFYDYPNFVRARARRYDLFHIADHSYAQLVHELPAHRTGVFCHDLDTYRCILDPAREPRPKWFRAMARRIIRGLQKAQVVFHSTQAVREEIILHGLVDPAKLVHAPYGISDEFTLNVPAQQLIDLPVQSFIHRPYVMHVGSSIPRKRIDVLLDVLAAMRRDHANPYPDLHLVQVGGDFTPAQREQIERLGLSTHITQLRGLSRTTIAQFYRQAQLVLQTSDSEGFGLPVAEALACGAVVIASDIPVLREVGGPAVIYCPVGDVPAWSQTAVRVLAQKESVPDIGIRQAQVAKYSWANHAQIICNSYEGVLAAMPASGVTAGAGRPAISSAVRIPKLGVLADFPEEGWQSMDLVCEMLLHELKQQYGSYIQPVRICPPFHRYAEFFAKNHRSGAVFNTDRMLNRFYNYPSYLRAHGGGFDFFHICDHSYAHLLHDLPASRTGVYCHDLDSFRSVLEPGREPRPYWFRTMARRVLTGFEKAAVVFHSTMEVRREIERFGLIDPARLIQALPGVAAEFTALPDPSRAEPWPIVTPAGVWPSNSPGPPFIMHVGRCVPRKRIDLLLRIFAGLRRRFGELHLVQVGGHWSRDDRHWIEQLNIGDYVHQLQDLSRDSIAALFRRAAVVLQPSEAEGFGIPVIEALACGAVVLASDISVLREVGADAVIYIPVGDLEAWVETAARIIENPSAAPNLQIRTARAGLFSWQRHGEIIFEAYRRLFAGNPASDP